MTPWEPAVSFLGMYPKETCPCVPSRAVHNRKRGNRPEARQQQAGGGLCSECVCPCSENDHLPPHSPRWAAPGTAMEKSVTGTRSDSTHITSPQAEMTCDVRRQPFSGTVWICTLFCILHFNIEKLQEPVGKRTMLYVSCTLNIACTLGALRRDGAKPCLAVLSVGPGTRVNLRWEAGKARISGSLFETVFRSRF